MANPERSDYLGSARAERVHPWAPARRRAFRRTLLAWFDREQRDMPWRGTRDPWAILVSEILLQQTRVETGTRYYHSLLARFPTPVHLARADDDALMKAWEGLGYYRRARNLRAAAQAMVARHEGKVPPDHAALLELPGIGPYTAGAVASIAFDLPQPCVDGNAARVVARLFAYRKEASTQRARRHLETLVRGLLSERSGAFNQALMELGSQVCTPRAPNCPGCPVARFCAAKAQRLQGRLPKLPAKAKSLTVRVAVALVQAGDHVLLVRNPDSGLLAGQWTLPTIETKRRKGPAAVHEWLARHLGLDGVPLRDLGPFHHAFSHRTWAGRVFQAHLERKLLVGPPCRWVARARWNVMPLTTATRRLLERHALAASVTVI